MITNARGRHSAPPRTPGASVTLDPICRRRLPFGIAQKEAKRLVFFMVSKPNGLEFLVICLSRPVLGRSQTEFL